jgi:hypothetical protein
MYAQNITPVENQFIRDTEIAGRSGTELITGVLSGLVLLGLIIGIVAYFLMFLVGGIGWITSSGDRARAEAARGKVTSALVGVTILLSLFAIVNILGCLFGASFTNLNIGPLNITAGDSPFCPAVQPLPVPARGGIVPPEEENPPADPPNTCGGTLGSVNPNCPCGGPALGKCAELNICAPGSFGVCFVCTATGWVQAEPGPTCAPITCHDCP